jgi:hypothetical protein
MRSCQDRGRAWRPRRRLAGERKRAQRIAIDSLSAFEPALALSYSEDFRESLLRTASAFRDLGVTVLMTTDLAQSFTEFGFLHTSRSSWPTPRRDERRAFERSSAHTLRQRSRWFNRSTPRERLKQSPSRFSSPLQPARPRLLAVKSTAGLLPARAVPMVAMSCRSHQVIAIARTLAERASEPRS